MGRDEVLAANPELQRQDAAPCSREELLELLRDHFGFGALGRNVRQSLEGDLLAAVRHGILVQHTTGAQSTYPGLEHTGKKIKAALKRAVIGLLHQGKLGEDGQWNIRRTQFRVNASR